MLGGLPVQPSPITIPQPCTTIQYLGNLWSMNTLRSCLRSSDRSDQRQCLPCTTSAVWSHWPDRPTNHSSATLQAVTHISCQWPCFYLALHGSIEVPMQLVESWRAGSSLTLCQFRILNMQSVNWVCNWSDAFPKEGFFFGKEQLLLHDSALEIKDCGVTACCLLAITVVVT